MNKTISIHLGGILFHLEESAYEQLQDYLKKIASYYETSPSKSEILEDIEACLAELFLQKISPSRQVITQKDIAEAIAILGKPEVIADREPENSQQFKENTFAHQEKRLYRDTDGATIAGVCAGWGHFFGLDKVYIRLAFAIAFLFLGSGILLYILLWIVTPEAKTTADKLRMKGRAIKLENIEQNLKSNLKDFSNRIENLAHEAEKEWKNQNAEEK